MSASDHLNRRQFPGHGKKHGHARKHGHVQHSGHENAAEHAAHQIRAAVRGH